ncbi:MAG TPA: transporter substrate-binding domain-containing protein [Azospirillum sp.]|nr:transporter substrate-binding domain-containing protein [Azospirillum sp.]
MRRTLRRIGLGILAGCAALSLARAAAAPVQAGATVRVAVMEATPPFSHRGPGGALTGFNVDIMRALCRAMAATCRFDEMPFQDVLEAVAAGRYEVGLGNFLRTPEREARVAFSAPYWRSSSSVVGPAAETDRTVPQAMAGRRLAVIRDSRQHAYAARIAATLAALVEAPHLNDVWQALHDGRADLALVPTLAAFDFLVSDEGKPFSTIGTPLVDDGLGGTVHIVLPRGRSDLKTAVDDAIAVIRADGSYQEVNRRYFPFDVY